MARPRKSVHEASSGDTVVIGCKLPSGLHIKHEEHGIDLKVHGAHSPYTHSGYGITRGVDAVLWAKIEEVFKGARWLKADSIFVVGDPQSAADRAEDQAKVKSGFDPIDPATLSQATGGKIQAIDEPDLGR